MNELLSVIIITRNRKAEVLDCLNSIIGQSYRPLEIVIVDNGSEVELLEPCKEKISRAREPVSFKFLKQKENKGVAGGRNVGVINSSGRILVFIDDDAIFDNKDSILRILEKFDNYPDLGILAFSSKNYYSGEINYSEFPHRDKTQSSLNNFETYTFVGVGHAIKKDVFQRAGFYPEDFFYGMEEFDLSYRAIDNNYKILYTFDVVVLHKKNPSGRQNKTFINAKLAENKIKVAFRNLPVRYVFSHLILWSGNYLFKSKFDLAGLFRLYLSLLRYFKVSKRKVVSQTTQQHIKSLGGTLWY